MAPSPVATIELDLDLDYVVVIIGSESERLNNAFAFLAQNTNKVDRKMDKVKADMTELEKEVSHYRRLSKSLSQMVNKLEARLQAAEAENDSLTQQNGDKEHEVERLMMQVTVMRFEMLLRDNERANSQGQGQDDESRGQGQGQGQNDNRWGASDEQEAASFACRRVVFRALPWHAQIEVKEEQDSKYYWRPANSRVAFQTLDDPDHYRCSICREFFVHGQPTIHLPCGHNYHGACADVYCKTQLNCPLCTRGFALHAELVPIELSSVSKEREIARN